MELKAKTLADDAHENEDSCTPEQQTVTSLTEGKKVLKACN